MEQKVEINLECWIEGENREELENKFEELRNSLISFLSFGGIPAGIEDSCFVGEPK